MQVDHDTKHLGSKSLVIMSSLQHVRTVPRCYLLKISPHFSWISGSECPIDSWQWDFHLLRHTRMSHPKCGLMHESATSLIQTWPLNFFHAQLLMPNCLKRLDKRHSRLQFYILTITFALYVVRTRTRRNFHVSYWWLYEASEQCSIPVHTLVLASIRLLC